MIKPFMKPPKKFMEIKLSMLKADDFKNFPKTEIFEEFSQGNSRISTVGLRSYSHGLATTTLQYLTGKRDDDGHIYPKSKNKTSVTVELPAIHFHNELGGYSSWTFPDFASRDAVLRQLDSYLSQEIEEGEQDGSR